MVVTEGDPANFMTLLMKQQRGAAFTSSYDEEKAAMRMALEWLLPSHAAAAIFTDSQSRLRRHYRPKAHAKQTSRKDHPTLDPRPPQDCWQ